MAPTRKKSKKKKSKKKLSQKKKKFEIRLEILRSAEPCTSPEGACYCVTSPEGVGDR
jgi:hypothetical protein